MGERFTLPLPMDMKEHKTPDRKGVNVPDSKVVKAWRKWVPDNMVEQINQLGAHSITELIF